MCLTVIDQKFEGNGRKIYTGWKVFRKYNTELNSYLFLFYDLNDSDDVSVGEWLEAECGYYDVHSTNFYVQKPHSYSAGFHIYAYEKDASKIAGIDPTYIVAKVRYRKILASGREGKYGEHRVDVAKEMYVIKRRSRKMNKAKN